MVVHTKLRRLALLGSAVTIAVAACVVPSPVANAARASQWDVGIGSKAALNGPHCDPATGRVNIPSALSPPCVKPWTKGANNGGKTYRGVTADTIKAVAYLPPNDVQLTTSVGAQTRNRSTGGRGLLQDSILDSQEVVDGRYENYGRQIEWSFVTASGTDEVAQRADAVTVAALDPFAVVAGTGGDVFIAEIAAKKILVSFGAAGTQKDNLAQQPYRYTGQDLDLGSANVATWLGKQIAGKKAEFAGDPALGKQTRKLGIVYQTSTTTGDQIDLDVFEQQLADNGVGKVATKVAFTVPDDAAAATQAVQEQAPTIAAKLKDAGVTSVVLLVGTTAGPPLTKAATANEYFPEWLLAGWGYQDIAILGTSYDPEQWKHAFGMAWFPPYATENAGAVSNENVFDWYWTKNKGTTSALGFTAVNYLNRGVHLAGPNLNPKTYRDGTFKIPGRAGAFDGQVTTQGDKLGDLGLGYPEYAILSPKDFALVWWDPDARGYGNVLGNLMESGNYRYLDGGKRYTLQTWKKGNPKFFVDLDTSITHYTTPPPKDLPHDYPCNGCPSAGGTQAPANVG
jgi:hypothetical protein